MYIYGDSNVRFLKESITGWHDFESDTVSEMINEITNKPEGYFTGKFSTSYRNRNINFIWQTRFPAARVNSTYLNEKFLSICDINTTPIFVFVYGRVDLTVERIKAIQDVDEQVPTYIKNIVDFSKKHNAKAFVCSAIINTELDKVDPSIVNHFNNLVSLLCSLTPEINFIDLDVVIGQDYVPEDWDKYNHPNRSDCVSILNLIVDSTT
jgi:hypothetical protein